MYKYNVNVCKYIQINKLYLKIQLYNFRKNKEQRAWLINKVNIWCDDPDEVVFFFVCVFLIRNLRYHVCSFIRKLVNQFK